MSVVKSIAVGLSMVMVAGVARSTSAGTIHSSASSHRSSPARTHETPTTFAFGPSTSQPVPTFNLTHQVGAENLAGSWGGTPPASSPSVQYGPAPTASPLALGLVGASSNQAPSSGSLGEVQNGLAPSDVPPSISSGPHADALINFGGGPYPEAASLTTGNAQGFFNSPVFRNFFGPNGPSINDAGNFENEVLATIKATYNNAGLAINLTADPNALAAHTMSVVSGTSYAGASGAIGITDVGNNGFSFIDKFAGVQSVDQLAIAVGHNLAHELMHAFGIADHPEQSGPYVDAATTTLGILSDPNTGFSAAAAGLLSTLNFQAVGQSVTSGAQRIDGDQLLLGGPSPVPEPSTVAVWSLIGGLLIAHRRRKAR